MHCFPYEQTVWGKVSAIRFSTLDAICRAQEFQPGDILEYRAETEPKA